MHGRWTNGLGTDGSGPTAHCCRRLRGVTERPSPCSTGATCRPCERSCSARHATPEAAADLVAEVCAAVLLSAGRYSERGQSAAPWVIGIACDKLLMSSRVEARARHRLGFDTTDGGQSCHLAPLPEGHVVRGGAHGRARGHPRRRTGLGDRGKPSSGRGDDRAVRRHLDERRLGRGRRRPVAGDHGRRRDLDSGAAARTGAALALSGRTLWMLTCLGETSFSCISVLMRKTLPDGAWTITRPKLVASVYPAPRSGTTGRS